MPKTALLFPGQGSQKVGMGLDLAETFPSARAIFDESDEALGFSLSKLCFEGPEEDLKLTENTQPAILTCSMAVLAVMREEGLADADFVAGHSLGEYSALVAAGALDFADAVKLVRAGVEAVGGKGGGGRPDLAQAGGPDGSQAAAALAAIEQALAAA